MALSPGGIDPYAKAPQPRYPPRFDAASESLFLWKFSVIYRYRRSSRIPFLLCFGLSGLVLFSCVSLKEWLRLGRQAIDNEASSSLISFFLGGAVSLVCHDGV